MRRALLWWCTGGVGWVLLGYPASLALAPRRVHRPEGPVPRDVTLVVCALGTTPAFTAKLRSIAALDPPSGTLQVVVALDEGDPAEVLRHLPDAEVDHRAARRGKAAALAAALGRARGDVVVLTDDNNPLPPATLRVVLPWFADPAVVAVAGLRGETGSAYDRYEDLLRRLESRTGSVAAVSGELLAVRRDRLAVPPPHVVNDDLWILLRALRQGGRVVYEPRAGGSEPALGATAELERRARIGAGRAALLGDLRGLPPVAAWRVANHKLGRLVLPFLWLGSAASAWGLRRQACARRVWQGHLGVLVLAGAGVVGAVPPGRAGMPVRAARQLTLGNVATVLGLVRAARHRQPALWERVR